MLLLEHKADVNAKDEAGITPLHLAALHGQASVAKTLLGAGATVDAIGFKDNDTPLIVAADNGRLGVVEVLLAYGANTNAVDKFGTTALQCARNGHHTNVAALLSK
jgi:ankyrin repeat protein